MSEDKSKISELIPKLMKRIGGISKDRTNEHQSYRFRGIDDVLNHVGPPCAELGVRVSVTVHDFLTKTEQWEEEFKGVRKRKFQVRSTLRLRLEFVAPDGSAHVSEAIGDAMDTNGDKATNKAMSAAFKYACFMGLVIPVEGALDDSDDDDKQPTPATANQNSPTPGPKPDPNEGVTRWEDWTTSKGTRLGDYVANGEGDVKEKEGNLKTLLEAYQKKAESAEDEPVAKKCYAYVEFIKQALHELDPF